tara:strand:- start:1 stop:129 length:129 start_codon:yes stop_codon:yes gene_type:complete
MFFSSEDPADSRKYLINPVIGDFVMSNKTYAVPKGQYQNTLF